LLYALSKNRNKERVTEVHFRESVSRMLSLSKNVRTFPLISLAE
jgi:hypothetical protein